MAGPDSPPPSAREQRFWPEPKALYHNFEELQTAINGRVDLSLSEFEKTAEALEDEQTRRFESENMPEITSPPAGWNHSFLQHEWGVAGPGQEIPSTNEVLDSFRPYIEPPLTDDEIMVLHSHCKSLCDVVDGRLKRELSDERSKIKLFLSSEACDLETYDFFLNTKFGSKRLNIVARHFVKRRWEHLGIWEKSWGIPGRDYSWAAEQDDMRFWSDRWRSEKGDADKLAVENTITELMSTRRSLSRGEWRDIEPRQRLTSYSPSADVWDFICSRPWFLWEVEKEEELIRFHRLPRSIRLAFNIQPQGPEDTLKSLHNRVVQLWKDRSVSAPEWSEPPVYEGSLPGWWWPHQTEHEEEDLSVLNKSKLNKSKLLNDVDGLAELGMSLSECDALDWKSPEQVTPEKRHSRHVHFDETQEPRWSEERVLLRAAANRHSEDAREYSHPNSPANYTDDDDDEDMEMYDADQEELETNRQLEDEDELDTADFEIYEHLPQYSSDAGAPLHPYSADDAEEDTQLQEPKRQDSVFVPLVLPGMSRDVPKSSPQIVVTEVDTSEPVESPTSGDLQSQTVEKRDDHVDDTPIEGHDQPQQHDIDDASLDLNVEQEDQEEEDLWGDEDATQILSNEEVLPTTSITQPATSAMRAETIDEITWESDEDDEHSNPPVHSTCQAVVLHRKATDDDDEIDWDSDDDGLPLDGYEDIPWRRSVWHNAPSPQAAEIMLEGEISPKTTVPKYPFSAFAVGGAQTSGASTGLLSAECQPERHVRDVFSPQVDSDIEDLFEDENPEDVETQTLTTQLPAMEAEDLAMAAVGSALGDTALSDADSIFGEESSGTFGPVVPAPQVDDTAVDVVSDEDACSDSDSIFSDIYPEQAEGHALDVKPEETLHELVPDPAAEDERLPVTAISQTFDVVAAEENFEPDANQDGSSSYALELADDDPDRIDWDDEPGAANTRSVTITDHSTSPQEGSTELSIEALEDESIPVPEHSAVVTEDLSMTNVSDTNSSPPMILPQMTAEPEQRDTRIIDPVDNVMNRVHEPVAQSGVPTSQSMAKGVLDERKASFAMDPFLSSGYQKIPPFGKTGSNGLQIVDSKNPSAKPEVPSESQPDNAMVLSVLRRQYPSSPQAQEVPQAKELASENPRQDMTGIEDYSVKGETSQDGSDSEASSNDNPSRAMLPPSAPVAKPRRSRKKAGIKCPPGMEKVCKIALDSMTKIGSEIRKSPRRKIFINNLIGEVEAELSGSSFSGSEGSLSRGGKHKKSGRKTKKRKRSESDKDGNDAFEHFNGQSGHKRGEARRSVKKRRTTKSPLSQEFEITDEPAQIDSGEESDDELSPLASVKIEPPPRSPLPSAEQENGLGEQASVGLHGQESQITSVPLMMPEARRPAIPGLFLLDGPNSQVSTKETPSEVDGELEQPVAPEATQAIEPPEVIPEATPMTSQAEGGGEPVQNDETEHAAETKEKSGAVADSVVHGLTQHADVKKRRGKKKAEHTGPLRRSTRAAAIQATARLAKMEW